MNSNERMLAIITTGYLFIQSNPVLANLTTTTRNLTRKTTDLGKIVIGLFIVVVGVYYVMGNDRAKEKAQSLMIGAFCILAGKSVLSWLQGAIR